MKKGEISHVLFDKVALLTLTRRPSKRRTRNCQQKLFRKIWTIYTQTVDQKMNFLMTLMKQRLHSFFTYLFQHFGIYLVFFAHKFFIYGHGNFHKIIYDVKLKVIYSHNRYGNNISNHTQNM